MGYVTVTQEQLAEIAGGVFVDSPVEDIPNKLWIDYWVGGDQHYLRAVFDPLASGKVFEQLFEIGQRIRRRFDIVPVCVVYSGEYSWEEIETWVQKLHKVS